VEFRLLGPLEVIGDDGLPVALGGPRPRALLAQLLLHPGVVVPRERLIDGIWRDDPPASAPNALQVHIHALRSALGVDRIVTRPPGYLLRVEPDELDAERFDRLVAAGELREALALWRGPALADVATEPLAQAAAAALEERRLTALEARIERDLDTGRHAALVGELEGLVASHPHRERLRAQRMTALYRAGRQADALAAYREARLALDELGLEPSPELRALERRILAHDPTLGAPAVEEPAAASARRQQELIGRARELAAITALFGRAETRLVTLTGPGGTGKTTLALAAGEQLGGAPFVDLAPVADPDRVLPAIAAALGIEERDEESPAETILRSLDGTARLVVVDNLEHLRESYAALAALLDAAPTLRVLATSRGPLHLTFEHEYRVPPLAVPEPGSADLEAVSTTAAVRLYVERARESMPEFELTDENAAGVVRITRALDGLPLAIELAAARVRVLGVEGTASRLGEALAFLTRTAPDLPERQRSLRATIDWSVRLLGPPAPHVLAVLGIFPAGATLEALEATADPGTDVATGLEALLDAGLVGSSLAGGSEPRFTMLETIRAYALAELEDEARLDELRRRQLAWCIELAGDEGRDRWWERGTPWLDRVEPELANVSAALDFARRCDDTEGELQLAASMRHFWRVRGHGVEAQRRMEDVVTRVDRVEPRLRARVLHETAVMRMSAGDYDGAREAWLTAMGIFTELGDDLQVARAQAELAALANAAGDPGAGIAYGEQAAAAFADEEFLRLIVLGNLAESYEQIGDLERGRATALEVLEAQRHIGDRDGVAFMSFALASMAVGQQDLAEAHRRLIECFTVAAEVGFVELTAYALGVASEIALLIGGAEQAAMLLGASWEGFDRIGGTPQAHEKERHERVRTALSEGSVDLERLLERGRAMRVEEAVTLAVALDTRER
jgi:predicted ATPase/DNA-binding SARP family transcriptional activator